jgi:hypothetical protein
MAQHEAPAHVLPGLHALDRNGIQPARCEQAGEREANQPSACDDDPH